MIGWAYLNTISVGLTRLADWLLAPFATAPRWGLLFWSAVAGVTMTAVFGKTSNQKALRRLADLSRAQLLAIRLFKDDLGVTFQCQLQLLRATALRLLCSLPPMLVMVMPFALVLTQLALRYEHRPLAPGETTLVQLRLAPAAWPPAQRVRLTAPDRVVVETESHRDATDCTLCWRIHSTAGRPATLEWQIGAQRVTKQLAAADDPDRLLCVSPRRAGAGVLDRLLHPAEPGLPADGPVRSITVRYPPRQTPILGMDLPWWATFLIASMFMALCVRRLLGVQF